MSRPSGPAPASGVEETWTLQVTLAFAAIYVIWGSTYLAIRFAIETIPPFTMAAIRFLVAGGLLAFTLSLDDFVITFFTSGPGTVTFPVKVYSMVRFSVTPEVNAASTVLIVITVALTAIAMWLQNKSRAET